MSTTWNSTARTTNHHHTAGHSAPAPRLRSHQVPTVSSWCEKMNEVEARIKQEKGNLAVVEGEVRLKDKEKQYLGFKLERLRREHDKLKRDLALEDLKKLVAEQAEKVEILKKSNLDYEQHGLEITSEKMANGATKRNADAARTQEAAGGRRVKRERLGPFARVKTEPGLVRADTGVFDDSEIEYDHGDEVGGDDEGKTEEDD